VTRLPKVGRHLVHAWNDGCTGYGDDDEWRAKCSGNAGAYRAMGSCTLFFLLAAVVARWRPSANREAWVAKYVLFLFMVAATVFVPNQPLFLTVYLHLSRIGGVMFILMQQVILIDVAYTWNDSWVTKADDAEMEERGSGRKWLAGILASCGVLLFGSIAIMILLIINFSGCSTNEAFIYVTLVMSVIITVAQLCSDEGSLLSSSIIVAYATYLVVTAVSKNPNAECNPRLGSNDIVGIVVGTGLTVLSLAWTGWSYTADRRFSNESRRNQMVEMSFPLVEGDHALTSSSSSLNYDEFYSRDADSITVDDESNGVSFHSWKLNIILAMISCWFSMAITGWGSIQTDGNQANPEVSSVSMWMIISSQWLVLLLYLWTLGAPKLFPDRDFF